jgi:hypothetical protein
MTMTAYKQLYQEATAAEDAWHNELVKQFGKQAGDKRYTKEAKGEPGSKLRQLHDNFSEC